MNYWLIKSEPFKYSWEQFVKDGQTFWDGVRNYAARNHLRAMKKGDQVLFYHSNEGLEVVGIAKVAKEAYQDPTTEETAWVVVDLKPYKKLKRAVSLQEMKKEKMLSAIPLIRIPRLSVMPLNELEFSKIIEMSERKS
ncbi:MAG: EVE domain-containing protein [Bacteroidia bacterium]|nr:EVE domain-containing protein [Bacteroidia bacterium]